MSEVIVVRTNHYDGILDAFIKDDLLRAEREILVVADESKQQVRVPDGIWKIVADPTRLGLHVSEDVMWRCGDYAVYAAMEALPRASAFWLIEPDVRIHSSDVKRFFDGTGALADRDFLTASFTPSGPRWMWHSTMTPFAPTVHQCMMQLCRFSRTAASHLYEQRLKLGAAFEKHALSSAEWPNDEAFVMSTLAASGLSFARLADHAPAYPFSGAFTFTKPISEKWLRSLPMDNRLYHPVVAGAQFLFRARSYLVEQAYSASRPKAILEEFESRFLPQVRMECGDQSAIVYQDEIRKVADWVAKRHNPA